LNLYWIFASEQEITMSELTPQELTGLDRVIEARKPLSDQINDVNNLVANFVTPTNNSSILMVENIGLTGGDGLSLDELTSLRGRSFR
jgi:hypothetical protein